jgi:hypothetical protein
LLGSFSLFFKIQIREWGYGPVVEHLPSIFEALDSSSSITKKKKKKKEAQIRFPLPQSPSLKELGAPTLPWHPRPNPSYSTYHFVLLV